MPLLQVERLRVLYGQIAAVLDASLEVDAGEIVALLGPNGAGKSTLLRSIAGLLRPASGSVILDGRDITRLRGDLVARHGVALVPEGRGIFPALSVDDNLRMGGYTAGADFVARVTVLREYFPILATRRRQAAGTLSGGEQQQLAIARALMSQPRLLMLDEMSLGLAPRVVAELFDILRRINAGGTAVLVVEQQVPQALRLAHRVYVLQRGRIVLSGTSTEVGGDAGRLSAAYLGADEDAVRGATARADRDESRLDTVELEEITVPLSLRNRRALQVLADRTGEPAGALVGRMIAEHIAGDGATQAASRGATDAGFNGDGAAHAVSPGATDVGSAGRGEAGL